MITKYEFKSGKSYDDDRIFFELMTTKNMDNQDIVAINDVIDVLVQITQKYVELEVKS